MFCYILCLVTLEFERFGSNILWAESIFQEARYPDVVLRIGLVLRLDRSLIEILGYFDVVLYDGQRFDEFCLGYGAHLVLVVLVHDGVHFFVGVVFGDRLALVQFVHGFDDALYFFSVEPLVIIRVVHVE